MEELRKFFKEEKTNALGHEAWLGFCQISDLFHYCLLFPSHAGNSSFVIREPSDLFCVLPPPNPASIIIFFRRTQLPLREDREPPLKCSQYVILGKVADSVGKEYICQWIHLCFILTSRYCQNVLMFFNQPQVNQTVNIWTYCIDICICSV